MQKILMNNGLLSDLNSASIPFSDRGFLFGHAVFETLLVLNGNIIEWENHYSRLQKACLKTHLICPLETDLRADCQKIIFAMNPNPRLSLKILITGGNHAELNMPFNKDEWPPANVYILCQSVSSLNLEERLKGFSLKSFMDERGSFLIGIKTTNYLFSFVCLEDAKETGFQDALFVNEKGDYTEGVTSNFLWFEYQKDAKQKYHVFSTPPQGNCLEGTSILKLKRVLYEANIPFEYRSLNKNKTTNCAGCALISSVRGIVPIKNIDNLFFDIEQHSTFFKFLIELINS